MRSSQKYEQCINELYQILPPKYIAEVTKLFTKVLDKKVILKDVIDLKILLLCSRNDSIKNNAKIFLNAIEFIDHIYNPLLSNMEIVALLNITDISDNKKIKDTTLWRIDDVLTEIKTQLFYKTSHDNESTLLEERKHVDEIGVVNFQLLCFLAESVLMIKVNYAAMKQKSIAQDKSDILTALEKSLLDNIKLYPSITTGKIYENICVSLGSALKSIQKLKREGKLSSLIKSCISALSSIVPKTQEEKEMKKTTRDEKGYYEGLFLNTKVNVNSKLNNLNELNSTNYSQLKALAEMVFSMHDGYVEHKEGFTHIQNNKSKMFIEIEDALGQELSKYSEEKNNVLDIFENMKAKFVELKQKAIKESHSITMPFLGKRDTVTKSLDKAIEYCTAEISKLKDQSKSTNKFSSK